jgi:S-adenosyl methyltransferase
MSTDDDASERVRQPNAARLYDYWLGGKDNFAADRLLASEIEKRAPWLPLEARTNRAFVRRAVGFLADSGVD